MNLGPTVNTGAAETVPTFSRDGHWMFFASTRAGGFGGNDIWASFRTHTHDDFGWLPPVNLGSGINTAFTEGGPAFLENDEGASPLLYFISDRPGGLGANDVYVSELQSGGAFGPATLVTELSSPANEGRPAVRHDGLEVIWFSNQPGSLGLQDLWASTRDTVFSLWSQPENLGALVNSGFDDLQPALSSDRTTLLFASNRPGGFGNVDLYVAVRAKGRGKG
jgi:Tol biopolymer transport system component